MLKDLIYKNFKCFKTNTRISFGGITLFYGKNSSGKTSAIKGAVLLKNAINGVVSSNYQPLPRRWHRFFHKPMLLGNPLIRIPSSRHSSLSLGGFKEIPTYLDEPIQVGASCYNSNRKKKIFPTNGFSFNLSGFNQGVNRVESVNNLLLEQIQILGSEDVSIMTVNLEEKQSNLLKSGIDETDQVSSEGSGEVYHPNEKAKEWHLFEQRLMEYLIYCLSTEKTNEDFIRKYGFNHFKNRLLDIHEDPETWFYGEQEHYDSNDLESLRFYEENYGFNNQGMGGSPMPFNELDPTLISVLKESEGFTDFVQNLIRKNDRELLQERHFEYVYYDKQKDAGCDDLGWIEAEKFDSVYGDSVDNLIFEEIYSLNHLTFIFIPLNFSRRRIYDLDEVNSPSNANSPEYNIANFLKFISSPTNVDSLNSELKNLGVGYELITPDFERMNGFFEIKIMDVQFKKELNIYDIGFGTTHFIFTLAAIMEANGTEGPRKIIFLEEPEVHCHPDLQGKLASVIIKAVMKGTQIVIDSHSEIFALAFSKALRDSKTDLEEFLDHEGEKVPAVVFNYFNKTEETDGTSISTIRLDSNGEFVDGEGGPAEWPDPDGFFGHRYTYA